MKNVRWLTLPCLFLAMLFVGCADDAPGESLRKESTTSNRAAAGKSPSTAARINKTIAVADDKTKPPNGSIAGRLTYRADSARPWRYGRYYIRDRKSGALAGAIVCLSSRSLRKYDGKKNKPKMWTMDQKQFEFRPEVLTIRAGDQVRFLNSDKATHNVHAYGSHDTFNLLTPVGTSLTRTFTYAGNERRPIDIRCDLHSQMRAWIYVFGHPFHQLTGPSGRFEFRDVPAGEYDLVAIHPAGYLRSKQTIRIVGGKKSSFEIVLSPDNLRGKSASK